MRLTEGISKYIARERMKPFIKFRLYLIYLGDAKMRERVWFQKVVQVCCLLPHGRSQNLTHSSLASSFLPFSFSVCACVCVECVLLCTLSSLLFIMSRGVLLLVALLSLLALVFCSQVDAQSPGPYVRYPGVFVTGNSDTLVHVEIFECPQCLHCREAQPVLRQLLTAYPPSQVKITYHLYPLNFHYQSYDAAHAIYTAMLASVGGSVQPCDVFQKFTKIMFDRQPQFNNTSWYTKSRQDLVTLFTQWAGEVGVDSKKFTAAWNDPRTNAATDQDSVYGKFRGVYSTPTFWINGLPVPTLGHKSSLADWKAILDPMVQSATYPGTRCGTTSCPDTPSAVDWNQA